MGGVLADEMGLGKSIQALTALAVLCLEKVLLCSIHTICTIHTIQNLRAVFHLVDSRHGLLSADEECLELLRTLPSNVEYVLVLTKVDKLRGQAMNRAQLATSAGGSGFDMIDEIYRQVGGGGRWDVGGGRGEWSGGIREGMGGDGRRPQHIIKLSYSF